MLYVESEDKFVYKVEMVARQKESFYYSLELELIAGWDYVNPDENNIQGYVGADRFTESVQGDYLTFYPMDETILERLDDAGYKPVTLEELKVKGFALSI